MPNLTLQGDYKWAAQSIYDVLQNMSQADLNAISAAIASLKNTEANNGKGISIQNGNLAASPFLTSTTAQLIFRTKAQQDEIDNAQDERIDTLERRVIRRYGYRRAKANSDPETRITYLYDAVGMTPAKMTFGNDGVGVWSYGDWQAFIEEIARPVMLKDDGTVDYELDHEDQTKKKAGGASDIANTSYAGNAMVEFGGAFKWVKRYEDNDYQYVIFADDQYDQSYHAYAHTSDTGAVKNAFYVGMFTGPYDSNNKLRSLATGGNPVSQTAEVEITRAKSVGDNFYTLYKSAWEYIGDLLTLIGKNDNCQAVFGSGVDSRKNSIVAPGTLKDKGAFYGTNNGRSSVKTLWIENFWGNMNQRLAGYINNSGNILTRMYGPYCDTPVSDADYSTYTDTGVTPSGTSGGYIKTAKLTDETGIVMGEASGSSTTYLCDALYFNNSHVDFGGVGAAYGDAAGIAGSRYVDASTAASHASAAIGARLSKKPA